MYFAILGCKFEIFEFANGAIQICIHFHADFLSILSVPETGLHVSMMISLNMSIIFYLSEVYCSTQGMETIRITSEKRGFPDRSENTNEDHISYTCDGGYYPVSPDGTSVCQEDGTRKPEMPACKKVKNSERAFHKYSTDFSNGPTWFHK